MRSVRSDDRGIVGKVLVIVIVLVLAVWVWMTYMRPPAPPEGPFVIDLHGNKVYVKCGPENDRTGDHWIQWTEWTNTWGTWRMWEGNNIPSQVGGNYSLGEMRSRLDGYYYSSRFIDTSQFGCGIRLLEDRGYVYK